ncbi:response regulator transcription factor [Kordiimonas sp.]|uniref:response regulator transcription factor n=1 Tax=Kordiimonas sp. TaxID=1970157 RepID=UPI003A932CA1
MRILIVEDDAALAAQMKQSLIDVGYSVDHAEDGEDGHFLGDTEPYDAIILDLGLPIMDGASVLKKWRSDGREMPVLILTARDGWTDKVEGLDAGADDYLTKPFMMEELLARLRALIRRSVGQSSPQFSCGPVILDTRNGRVSVDGRAIKLTAQEFKLLSYLMHHEGKVISRTELTEHIYDQDFDRDSNTIEVFVNRIRKKLDVPIIGTVRGLGYRLEWQEGKA